ncbi:MAG: zinc finger protein [Bacteroidales bacterium]|nr:zinc finger protein [Bacteroidales bacterium]
MAIKVGRWDCTQCGFTGNLGPNTRCEKCGAPRPENVKFYLPEYAEIVHDTQNLNEAKSGANWVCSYCSAHNKATQNTCQSCGNDRDLLDGDKNLQEKIHLFNQNTTAKKNTFKFGKGLKIALIGLFSFIVLFVILTQIKSDVEVSVTSCSWERSISIEEYKRVIEEDWKLPSGAEKINSYNAIHHYDQVADGTETRTRTVQKQVGTEQVKVGEKDLGNGYFEDIYEERPVYEDVEETYEATKYKQVPVYQTKYKYAVFRWMEADKITSSGTKKPACWPEDERLTNKNKYRIKQRDEKYYLHMDFEGENVPEKVSYELWKNTNVGDILVGEKSRVLGTYFGLKKN